MTVLPVDDAACPACGARDGRPAFVAPAQLVDLDQTFRFVTCGACELVYLRDRVRPEATRSLYDADYPLLRGPALWGPFAGLVEADDARVDSSRVQRVLAHRPLGYDDAVLDVGCGRGTFSERIAAVTGCRSIGIDVAAAPARSDRTRIVVGMPPDWPPDVADAAPYSVVTMWHFLEHDPSPVRTLAWLRDRVRDDAVAIVEVPDASGSTARWMGRWWPGLHTPRHASVFTPTTLEATVERAGWTVVTHERRGTLRPWALVALGALDRAGFRFGRHRAALAFPFWAAGMAATWPWLGRPSRVGAGLQTIVLRP